METNEASKSLTHLPQSRQLLAREQQDLEYALKETETEGKTKLVS